MNGDIIFWCQLYDKLKKQALCLDIETTGMNKPISLVGLYRPKEGAIEHEVLIKGKNLTTANLQKVFMNCKMIITYNGRTFDVPRINKEFPGAIPRNIPHFDVYHISKAAGFNTNLKALEQMLGIERLRPETQKRGIAVKLWRKYKRYNHLKALETLIEYNKQDAVNLYPISEKLVELINKKSGRLSDMDPIWNKFIK